MNLQPLLLDYVASLRTEQGATESTRITYQNRLRNLHKFLSQNETREVTTDDFNLPTLRRYLYALTKAGNRPRTIRAAFNAVRSFGAFLVREGILDTNPAMNVPLPKLDAAQRLTMTDDHVRALFDAAERQLKPRDVALANAVLSVFLLAGLRRCEAYQLKTGDLDFAERSLLVRSGKGQKSRKVYLSKEATLHLREWITLRGTCRHDWLFAYDINRRLHDESFAEILEGLKAIAGLRDVKAIAPHSCRHWYATNALRNGANLRDVQALLGHSDIATTSRYLHTDEEQLRGIAELTGLKATTSRTETDNIIHLPARKEETRSRRLDRRGFGTR